MYPKDTLFFYTPAMKELHIFFSDKETVSIIPVRYNYIKRKKVVTFVPLSHTDKLTFDMASAGAGLIGEYSLCSFRMKGIGTFLPGTKTSPFSGKKGRLSFEEEIRLEMECDETDVDKVTEALISNHPYEEPAYEIYEFLKRDKNPSEFVITFRRARDINTIIKKLNRKIKIDITSKNMKARKIYITYNTINKATRQMAAKHNAEAIISLE